MNDHDTPTLVPQKRSYPFPVLYSTVLLIAGLLLSLFTMDAMIRASQKTFWTDEHYTIKIHLRENSYRDLLLHGLPPSEGSRSPLYFLIPKYLDAHRENFHWLGFSPGVYYRLFSILVASLGAGLLALLLFREIHRTSAPRGVQATQLFLLLLFLVTFLFHEYTWYYAVETRPYILWNTLWLLILALALTHRKQGLLLSILLCLLALTTSASLFQVLSLAGAFFIVNAFLGIPFKKNLTRSLYIFLPPFLLCLYYTSWGMTWTYPHEQGVEEAFFNFWNGQRSVALLSLMGIGLCAATPSTRKYAIVSLSMLILYFLEPVICGTTLSKHYFVTERQYMFNGLAVPVFLLTLMQCLPALIKMLPEQRKQTAALLAVVFLSMTLFYPVPLHVKLRDASNNVGHFLKNPEMRSQLSFKNTPLQELLYWRLPHQLPWSLSVEEKKITGVVPY